MAESYLGGSPGLTLRYSACPGDVADKYGSGDSNDVFLQVVPPDMMAQSDKNQIIECVRQGAKACGRGSKGCHDDEEGSADQSSVSRSMIHQIRSMIRLTPDYQVYEECIQIANEGKLVLYDGLNVHTYLEQSLRVRQSKSRRVLYVHAR